MNCDAVYRYLCGIHQYFADNCAAQSPFADGMEMDEFYFDGRRINGKRRATLLAQPSSSLPSNVIAGNFVSYEMMRCVGRVALACASAQS